MLQFYRKRDKSTYNKESLTASWQFTSVGIVQVETSSKSCKDRTGVIFSPSIFIPGSLHFSAFFAYIFPYEKFRLLSLALTRFTSPHSSIRLCLLPLALIRSLSRSSWLRLCLLILTLCCSLSRSVFIKPCLANLILTLLSLVDIPIELP